MGSFELNVKNVKTERDAQGILYASIAVAGLAIAILWSAWRTLRIDDTLRGVMIETAKTTSMVFIILIGAAMLTAAFAASAARNWSKRRSLACREGSGPSSSSSWW